MTEEQLYELRSHNDTVFSELEEMAEIAYATNDTAVYRSILLMQANARAIDHMIARMLATRPEVQP